VDNRFRPWRALIFVVTTLGLLAFTYFLVFRVDLGGSVKVTVRFGSVGTIQAGSPVRQSGVKVGSVSKVALAPNGRGQVDVDLSLYQGLQVRTKDRISIVTAGLLGDQFIDIVPGDADAPIADPEAPLIGQSGLDLKVLVDGGGDLIRDLSVSSRAIATFLAAHSDALDHIVADAQRGVSHAADAAERADRLLEKAEKTWDPAVGDVRATLASLRETSSSLQRLVEALGAPGTLGALLTSPTTARSASETLDNLKASSRSLKVVTDALESALK
jgi:phospholipid/cholesterol/gamma-HCH transport system substrate-binding protein